MVAVQGRSAAAAHAELMEGGAIVPRGRVVDYGVGELRSGGGRAGRPVARGHEHVAGGTGSGAEGGGGDGGDDGDGEVDAEVAVAGLVEVVHSRDAVTQAAVRAVTHRGRAVGLVGSVAAARRRRVWAVRARRARAGRGHVYTSRRVLDYARAAAAPLQA